MPHQPTGLPDPLRSPPKLPLDDPDELISQLAGEEIARLLGPSDNWQPRAAPPARPVAPAAPVVPPVEELTAKLDQIFEEIELGRLHPEKPGDFDPLDPPGAMAEPLDQPEPVLAMRRVDEIERLSINDARSALIAPLAEEPLPAMLRPLAWINQPVNALAPGWRKMVSVVSLLSFAGSVSLLVYVLILRQG